MSPKEKRASGVGALVFTVLALLFTGVTAWLLAMMLSGTQYTKEPVLPVVVTQSAVEPLGPLTEANLKVVKLPESTIPAGHFTEISQLVHTPPTRSLVAMHEGEIVFKDRLVDLENGKGLASLVPSGMRAMVIKLDDAAVQAGLFQPDTMVDVIATLRLIKQSTVVSRVIVQGVKVMAVGKSIDPSHMAEPSGAGTLAGKSEEVDSVVTLLVSPAQAEKITLAQREGRVDLVLRSQKDEQLAMTVGAQPEDLFPELGEGSDEGVSHEVERAESSRRIVGKRHFRKSGGGAAAQAIEVH